jgi:hypothetical protein
MKNPESPMISRRGLLAMLPLSTCAGLPREDTAGSPAPRWSALVSRRCTGAGRVACTTHTFPQGDSTVWLQRGDGAPARRLRVLACSPRMDFSILEDGEGLLAPADLGGRVVAAGNPVWAAGMPGIGAGLAAGVVEIPDAILPRFGRGFTACLAALMGYSAARWSGRTAGCAVSSRHCRMGAAREPWPCLAEWTSAAWWEAGTARFSSSPSVMVMEEVSRLRLA